MKIVAFQVTIGGVPTIVNDLKSLESAIKLTNEELKKSGKFGSDEYKRLTQQLGALKETQKTVNNEVRNQGREFVINQDKGNRSYRALNAELVNARAKFRELSEAERKSDVGKNLVRNIQELDKELKDLDASIGNYQRNVGNYRQALTTIGDIVTGGLLTGGITSVIRSASEFISEAIDKTAQFNRNVGILGQVSGAAFQTIEIEGQGAVNALDALREKALELGASTEFTASQVVDLEVAYAKLGFTPVQIFELLSSTIDTATVSGEDLGRTATVIGTTLRAFNLEASEGGRVANVLAKAFSSSSLDLSKFDTAVATVGASASAVGLTLEETTALLGTLTDAGFDASTAATSLRNIFLENATQGLSLEQALKAVGEAQNSLVKGNEEYGKRGAAQSVVLANNTEKVRELTEALKDSNGFSEEAAKVIRDDLQGALDGLESATEGLQLALVATFGETYYKEFIEDFTDFIRNVTEGVGSFDNFSESLSNVGSIIINFLPSLVALRLAIAATALQSNILSVSFGVNLVKSIGAAVTSSRVFTAAQTALNAVLRANPIGLIITALALVAGGLVTAYEQSETFRASIDGIGNVAKEVFTIVKEALSGFVEGFNALKDGDLSGGLKKIGQSLIKGNPLTLAFTEGERLSDAFSKGYEDSIKETELNKATAEKLKQEKEELKKTAKETGEEVAETLDEGLNTNLGLTVNKLKQRRKELQKELNDLEVGSAKYDEISEEIKDIDNQLAKLKETNKATNQKTQFEELNDKLGDLKSQIQDAILQGTDYSNLLKEYEELYLKSAKAQEEYKLKVDDFITANRLAAGSIEFLNAEISRLNSEITKSSPDNITDLVVKLTEAEKKLQDAKNQIERTKIIALNDSRTGLLDIDIEKDINNINLIREQTIASLNQINLSEKDFANEKRKVDIAAEIAILQQKLRLYKENSNERLKIENELAVKLKESQQIGQLLDLENEKSKIRDYTNQRILANSEIKKSDEKIAAEREVIEAESNLSILQKRLEIEELTNSEKLSLLVEIKDAEVALEKAKNDLIIEERKKLNKDTIETFSFASDSILSAIDSITEFQNASYQRRISQINNQYDTELRLAEGNTERITQLEEERDAKIQALQEEQFERAKRLQIAQAIIGGAQAVISTLAAAPGAADILSLGLIRAVQVGLIVATTAAQIAQISSQTFAEGGYTGSGYGIPDKTGYKPAGIVHENEYVVPKKVLKTKKGSELVRQLENIRKNINPNTAFLDYISAKNGLFATGGFANSNIQPNLQNQNNLIQINSSAQFSDNQISLLADIIGQRVYQGIYTGSVDVASEQELIRNRRINLIQNI